MKRITFPLLLISILFWTCSQGGGDTDNSLDLKPAEGGRFYGGVFKVNEVEYFRSLYPLNITEVVGHRITNQIYEGLVRLSQKDLTVQPLIAERWEVDSNAMKFTFYLRKGVYFHDNPVFEGGKGREVTAHDFKYCLTRLCESDVNNQGFWIFKDRVKGSNEYFDSTVKGAPLDKGVEGIKVIDDYTLSIELDQPFASFLSVLAMPFVFVYPKEAIEKNAIGRTSCVGTGPYQIKALKEDETVILTKNQNYWDKDEFGNQLPFLDVIKWTFIKDQKAELLEFRRGNLDMVHRLPLEMIEEVVDRNDALKEDYKEYTLQVMPSLSVQYYGFQHLDKLFSNKLVRKAFNFAIDRDKIVDFTLKGSGIAATYGFVPPAFSGYDSKAVSGYNYNPEKARKIMAEAGYPDGKGFPEITLQLNAGGGTNEQVAEAVQKMLQENLNIGVNITKLPFAQHLENLETGKANFWRLGWVADYPDPQNFLNLFYSKHIPATMSEKSYLNATRYSSAEYDSLLEMALRTVDDDNRNLIYLKCDQLIIEDAAVLPIYYYKDHRLIQKDVMNFPQNAMEYRNFRDVYFVPNAN